MVHSAITKWYIKTMDKEYINDLIARLRSSATPAHLREEVIRTLSTLRFAMEDVHASAKQNGDRSAELISGAVLGKPGYCVGDMGM